MSYLVRGKRIVLVGVPGVGKTTVSEGFIERLKEQGKKVKVVVYGTVMLEEAKKRGVKDRDELRKMDLNEMKKIQIKAASRIGRMNSEFLLIDTHLVIRTKEGYLPGLPSYVVKRLKPTNLIFVTASPEEIRRRRVSDDSRKRDLVALEEIEEEIEMSLNFLTAVSNDVGAPVMIVKNEEGKVEEAVKRLMNVFGV